MTERRSAGISAVVRTFNEADNLRECLDSLTWAGEILVVDSFSTDDTVAIARKFTDRVIVRPYAGQIEKSQFTTDQAAHRWVLHVDADERVTPELRDEILVLDLENTTCDAFDMPRRHFFMKRWINHSGWYPDRNIRLYRKDRCRWGGYEPHDKIQVPGVLGHLRGDLLHYIYRDIDHFAAKKNSYATMTALDHERSGRRARIWHLTVRPVATFFIRYLIRLGILDGLPGFVICTMESYSVFLKYAKLYEMQHRLQRFPYGEPRT